MTYNPPFESRVNMRTKGKTQIFGYGDVLFQIRVGDGI